MMGDEISTMPRNFYILRDDRGRYAVSNGPFIPEDGSSFRTPNEAMDHVRELIAEKGLVMGRKFHEGGWTRVEAIEPDDRPMLYSPEAMRAVEFIKDRLDRSLKRRALDLARREGRN